MSEKCPDFLVSYSPNSKKKFRRESVHGDVLQNTSYFTNYHFMQCLSCYGYLHVRSFLHYSCFAYLRSDSCRQCFSKFRLSLRFSWFRGWVYLYVVLWLIYLIYRHFTVVLSLKFRWLGKRGGLRRKFAFMQLGKLCSRRKVLKKVLTYKSCFSTTIQHPLGNMLLKYPADTDMIGRGRVWVPCQNSKGTHTAQGDLFSTHAGSFTQLCHLHKNT